MQSSLLKSVCYILIINVTFCRSCYESICKARCYFKHRGFDYGVCTADKRCVCNPADIYVFDGIDRAGNSEYIKYSIGRIGYRNEIWKKIVRRITTQYPSIKIEDLKTLQTKIYAQQPALYGSILQYFFTTYKEHDSLETVLNELIIQYPEISEECNNLLMLLKRSENNDSQNMYTYEEIDEDEILPPIETPPIETPPIETPPIETPPIETPPAETSPTVTTTITKGENNNQTPRVSGTRSRSLISADAKKQPNSDTKLLQTASKPNTVRKTVEETSKTHEKIEYVTYEEVSDEESEEYTFPKKSHPIKK